MTALRVGQTIALKGCFTEENFLLGLSVDQIARELGLPQHRMQKGIFVAFALQLPAMHEFKLGGWAEYSTDSFIEYRKNKMKWSETEYERVYDGKRMPISIDDAKRGWLSNMNKEKLIKMLPVIAHEEGDFYPPGGKASQIILVHPVKCLVTRFLNPRDTFTGVW